MYEIAILEDNKVAAENLKNNILKFSENEKEYFNIHYFSDALGLLDSDKLFDVLFMDIEMPGMNGMEAAKRIRQKDGKAIIIFVTNVESYAPASYEVNAMDFIVKPVTYSVFYMKMKRAVSYLKQNTSKTVAIKIERNFIRIDLRSLIFIETSGHNLIFHTDDKTVTARGKLSDWEDQLKGESFARCNSCYLVNLAYVTEVVGSDVYVGNVPLKISRAKKAEFLNRLTAYFGGNKL